MESMLHTALLLLILSTVIINAMDVQHTKAIKKWRNHWKQKAINLQSINYTLQDAHSRIRESNKALTLALKETEDWYNRRYQELIQVKAERNALNQRIIELQTIINNQTNEQTEQSNQN